MLERASVDMALSTKGMFDVKVWDDIEERCGNESLVPVIANRVQLFYPINPEHAIKKLTQVGHLLQLAYAGTKSQAPGPLSARLIEVVILYQALVKDAVAICTSLTNISLESLSFHKSALIYAEKGKPNKSIGFLGRCAIIAGKMSEQCDKMILGIEKLSASSLDGFTMVKEKFEGSEMEQQAVSDRANKLNTFFETTANKMKALEALVEDAKAKEAESAATVKKDIKARLIYGLLGPISYVASNAEANSNELKLTLQNEARDVNMDLQGSIVNLLAMDYTTSQLHTSIMCLEICLKILAKVKTMFVHAKQFWSGVVNLSAALGKSETADELKDDDVFEFCKNAFLNEIKTSGLGWLATSKICRQAALNIRGVSHGVDRTNTTLFGNAGCTKLIQDLGNELLSDLVEENEMIEDVKSDWLYEVLVRGAPRVKPTEEKTEGNEEPFNYLNGTAENEDEVVMDATEGAE